jgi:hypothetical protein
MAAKEAAMFGASPQTPAKMMGCAKTLFWGGNGAKSLKRQALIYGRFAP